MAAAELGNGGKRRAKVPFFGPELFIFPFERFVRVPDHF
jgi:hypothetical protein